MRSLCASKASSEAKASQSKLNFNNQNQKSTYDKRLFAIISAFVFDYISLQNII